MKRTSTLNRLIRASIIESEQRDFETLLRETTPMDTWSPAMRARCAREQLSTRAAVAWTHGAPQSIWQRASNGESGATHALFLEAEADDPPEWLRQRLRKHARRGARLRTQWLGRVVGGREVVAVDLWPNGYTARLTLRCPHCGADSFYSPSSVRGHRCRCQSQRQHQSYDPAPQRAKLMNEFKALPNGWVCADAFPRQRPRCKPGTREWWLRLRHPTGAEVERRAGPVRHGQGLAPPGSRYCFGVERAEDAPGWNAKFEIGRRGHDEDA